MNVHSYLIRPGSIQARGENLFRLLKAFTNSPLLKTANEREAIATTSGKHEDDRAVFFDYLSWFLVYHALLFLINLSY